jgi:quinohemoprotein ethanol dehydrogenase
MYELTAMKRIRGPLVILALTWALIQCGKMPDPGSEEHIKLATAVVDDAYLVNADNTPENWVTYGKNYAEDRFSSLKQINTENVGKLGLAWALDLQTTRGIEATPLVVDGIMFLTGPWSKVFAVDARTGKMIWTYDPEVPGKYGERGCCDVVNRGLALYKGRVFLGTFDGRLISLDASNGKLVWEVLTVDTTRSYTITGAPRIVKGKVIIGNGGAEFGVRGYITAYDAMTGEQQWRFYTVPGDPSKPFESKAMEMAAKTWSGDWWKYGGGGTAWDAMAFDPELNLFYVGTGNGSPWDWFYRSNGQGDNLFLSSIVALNPDTGEYVWHYQTTPGDDWDYTATQQLILTDMEIKGQQRKVIMQAPKNGFFYVLDRITGKLLSAEPYTYMNWATHVDTTSGKPVETEFSRYSKQNVTISPGPNGGHNWHSMAYNPVTKLVYIPAQVNFHYYGRDSTWKFNEWNKNISVMNPNLITRADENSPENMNRGHLLAWNPLTQKLAWKVEHPGSNIYQGVVNGGVMTSAGGLVFQGTAYGKFIAYDAADGKKLWEYDLGAGVVAPPITYMVDGVQYVSLAVGWGGATPALWVRFTEDIYPGTIFTFALDANQRFAGFAKSKPKELINLTVSASEEELKNGQTLYQKKCLGCHGPMGANGGSIPNLTYSNEATFGIMEDIVLNGMYLKKGMPNFSGRLSRKDVSEIKKYILHSASELRATEKSE